MLDLGCGTGCIGLTLALEAPCTVTLADLSEQALALARRNAERLCAKAEFLRLDMLAPPPEGRQWELIVSNPPYLTGADMLVLEPALRFEPAMALFGGEDGLDFYRALTGLWVPALVPGECCWWSTAWARELRLPGFFRRQASKMCACCTTARAATAWSQASGCGGRIPVAKPKREFEKALAGWVPAW